MKRLETPLCGKRLSRELITSGTLETQKASNNQFLKSRKALQFILTLKHPAPLQSLGLTAVLVSIIPLVSKSSGRIGISRRSSRFRSDLRSILQILQPLYICYNAPTIHTSQVLWSYTSWVSPRGRLLLPPLSHSFQLNLPFFPCFTPNSCLPKVTLISPTQCHTQGAILAPPYQTLWV